MGQQVACLPERDRGESVLLHVTGVIAVASAAHLVDELEVLETPLRTVDLMAEHEQADGVVLEQEAETRP